MPARPAPAALSTDRTIGRLRCFHEPISYAHELGSAGILPAFFCIVATIDPISHQTQRVCHSDRSEPTLFLFTFAPANVSARAVEEPWLDPTEPPIDECSAFIFVPSHLCRIPQPPTTPRCHSTGVSRRRFFG